MHEVPSLHPDLDRLAAFLAGKLDDADSREVEHHLVQCETCAHALETIPQDRLVTLIRQAAVGVAAESDTAAGGGVAVAPGVMLATPQVPGRVPIEVPRQLADHPRYRILALLGAGGMGVVYKAEHRLMRRPVALKVISRELTNRPAAVERFRREVQAAARLAHPNIVTAHDAEQAGDTHFLVMEFVEGQSLARVVATHGPLPVGLACEYVRQVALGLQHAFERGMVHRDIKPQNLMLTGRLSPPTEGGTSGGQVKILDFGLARFLSESGTSAAAAQAMETGVGQDAAVGRDVHELTTRHSLTGTGIMLGTADYIAPEQARDPHAADIRADIYSLGCTLYYLLTGRTAFPSGSAIDKLLGHLERTPEPLAKLRGDVPPDVAALVARTMAKDPAERFQTPADLAAALAPFCDLPAAVGHAARVPVAPAVAPPRGATNGPRRWPLRAAVTVVLLAVAAALVYQVIRVVTPHGELVIETSDPKIAVTITRDSVQIFDSTTERQFDLKVGKYGIELADQAPDLRISHENFTIRRGEQVIVRIWREQPTKPDAAKPAPVAAKAAPTLPEGTGPAEAVARFINPETVGELRRLDGHTGLVRSLSFSRDGRRAASASWDGSVRLWDVETGQEIRVMRHPGARSLSFSPDGRRLLSAGLDKLIRLWDAETGTELGRLEGHTSPEVSVQFLPDGRRAVTGGGSGDNSVRVWDLESRRELRRLKGHEEAVFDVAVSPDGSRAASAGYDNTVRVWNVETGEEVCQFAGHSDKVTCVAFSPDGRRVVSAGFDWTIRLWDAATGKLVRNFDGHSAVVEDVDFSGYGRRIISASHDGTVRLWDVATGRELRRIKGHDGPVSAVAFHPEGRTAISGGHDNSIRLWSLPADHWIPLSLEDWLKGREVLTVAQDGRGRFRTIQAAVDALQPGQVVEVLDRGPYRERLRWPNPPADVGLISRAGTRIELPDWEKLPADAGRSQYRGWQLGCQLGLRLSGFQIGCPATPDDASSVTAVDVSGMGYLAIESCRIEMAPPAATRERTADEPPPRAGTTRLIALSATTPEFSNPPAGLYVANNELHGELSLHFPAPMVIEQNRITAAASDQAVSLAWFRPGDVAVRHNIIRGTGGIRFNAGTADEKNRQDTAGPRVLIANNVIDVQERAFLVGGPEAGIWRWLPAKTRIQNNVFRSHQHDQDPAFESDQDWSEVHQLWQVDHNAYVIARQRYRQWRVYPKGPTDRVVEPTGVFLSDNPGDSSFMRIPPDSPLATAGAGDDLPRYTGAFPPGPSPRKSN